MLRKEDFMLIQALVERGVYQKDIAEQLGVHPKTVSRALRRGSAPARPRRRRPSKLDPFKSTVDQLIRPAFKERARAVHPTLLRVGTSSLPSMDEQYLLLAT